MQNLYILGHLDIDYFKYDEYMPTSTFLDVFYTHNVFPVLSKPTHVTKNTANLIDHILTNNFDMSTNHKQRIIWFIWALCNISRIRM